MSNKNINYNFTPIDDIIDNIILKNLIEKQRKRDLLKDYYNNTGIFSNEK